MQNFLKLFYSKQNWGRYNKNMCIGLRVKYPLSLPDLNETRIFSTDFRKSKNLKFHENPFSVSRVVSYGQTHVTKLIVAFRNFAKAPKNVYPRTDQEGQEALFKLGASEGGWPTPLPDCFKQAEPKKKN